MTERIVYRSDYTISLEDDIDDLQERRIDLLRLNDRILVDKRLTELRNLLKEEGQNDTYLSQPINTP